MGLALGRLFVETGRALRRLAPGQARERTLIAGGIAAIAGFLIAGLFEFNFGDSEVAMLAYAVMAVAFAATRQEATPQRRSPEGNSWSPPSGPGGSDLPSPKGRWEG